MDIQNNNMFSNTLTSLGTLYVGEKSNYSTLAVQLSGTWSGTITFQQSNDGVSWCDCLAEDRKTGLLKTTATTAGLYLIQLNAKYYRAQVTTFTSGEVTATCSLYVDSVRPFGGIVTGTQVIEGPISHDSAGSTAKPLMNGLRAITSNYTPCASNDMCHAIATTQGVQIVKLNQIPENTFNYNNVITTATTAVIKTAGATGIRNYLTGIQLQNTSASPCVVQIADGSTVLWSVSLPANMVNILVVDFQTPLRGSSATAINIITGTASNVYVNAQGYQAT